MSSFRQSRIFSRSLTRLLLPLLLFFVFFTLTPPQPAAAHPLGNFSINRYSRLTLESDQIHLFYVLDMAEIPTFQDWSRIDVDKDGQINESENAAYLSTLVLALQNNLTLQANGASIALKPAEQTLTFPPGQGDLPTMRLEVEFLAPLPTTNNGWQVTYHDGNYADRLGWQEVIVQASRETTLLASTAPSEDLSQALRQYPEDLLKSPLTVNQAEFHFFTGSAELFQAGGGVIAEAAAATPAQNRFNADQFAELITIDTQNPVILMGALVLAVALGAAHALTPGHGKTIVGAYLVGSRGTAKHALFLGLITTFTHTAGVFLFGLLVLFASQFILPEQLYPWLGVFSGLLVVGIGFSMFRDRWRRWRGSALGCGRDGEHHDDHQHHPHPHDHTHEHDHSHDHGHPHHTHPQDNHGHDHGDGHHHHHILEDISWRSLLALGISGGLLPCPSALVLLLSAIALGRVGLGLVLILAFSVGLAGVLSGIGLILVYAGRFFDQLPTNGGRAQGYLRVLPVASALFISLAGIGITVQAVLQTGLF